jgi:hypothetical protein
MKDDLRDEMNRKWGDIVAMNIIMALTLAVLFFGTYLYFSDYDGAKEVGHENHNILK